jgi:hypothetical protein
MLLRMSGAQDASEAGRALAQRRWGSTVITRSIQTLVERRGELGPAEREALAFLAQDPKGQRDD